MEAITIVVVVGSGVVGGGVAGGRVESSSPLSLSLARDLKPCIGVYFGINFFFHTTSF